MVRRARYRTGDPPLDEKIGELIKAVEAGENSDLIYELVVSALRLAQDHASRGDLKIANAALKEMRYAFHIFAPFRQERKAAMFGSARITPDEPLYDQARRMATALAAKDWMVITGAGPGIMSAGIEGAGPENSFGVTIRLPFEGVTSEFLAGDPKVINFRYFFTRKLAFIKESDGFVLLPGGFGTMDETFELITLLQTGKAQLAPIVLLDVPGGTFWHSWRRFVEAELLEGKYIGPNDLNFVLITDNVETAVDEIVDFYSNYHSLRFVDGQLILRLQQAPSSTQLEQMSNEFSDIIVRDSIVAIEPTPEEIADNDHLDLDRIAFRFDRAHWARLREMINVLNNKG